MTRKPDFVFTIDELVSAPARLQAERDLRMAAEKRAEMAEARVAELSAALDGALSDRHFYWKMVTEQAHELALLREAATR